jgi:acyl carrier protein
MEKSCHAEPAIVSSLRNPGVAEFFEPRGAALCIQCDAILHRLRNRLVFSYHLEPGRITLERPLAKDFDSLDVVELVMALEEELRVKISDKEADEVKTMQDLIRLIRRYAGLKLARVDVALHMPYSFQPLAFFCLLPCPKNRNHQEGGNEPEPTSAILESSI